MLLPSEGSTAETRQPDPARLETRSDGYVRWRSWDPKERRERYVYVHQLLAIAEGGDPEKVFSGGRYHVHHVDELRWHNVPQNIEIVDSRDHARNHDHLGVVAD